MPIEIIVPRLGWSTEEGVFAGWLKKHGDKVASGEPLFALESDKVTMEVESLDCGTLHILPEGPETGGAVKAGQRLGYLLAEGEYLERPSSSGRASPRARATAESLGIDLSLLRPAPGSSRISEADVLRTHEKLTGPAAPRARSILAARMEESFRTPHFYVHADADVSQLARMREELLPIVEERHQVRVTYNDLFVKAIAAALHGMPRLNCYWSDGQTVFRSSIDVGLVVHLNGNLLVPVIRAADRLTVAEIAIARRDLVEKCRRSKAEATDFEGGSVTLSNLGPFGVDRFEAILNPPQSAIIATGRIAKRPFVEGDSVVARLTLPLSISVDHRVIDGVAAAGFLHALVNSLQSPLRLVLPYQ